MHIALVTVLVAGFLLFAGILLMPQDNQPSNSPSNYDGAYAACESSCTGLVPTYRANPSIDFRASDFCILTFNTYEHGGIFSDHCYREDNDLVRYACVLSSLDGTTIELDRGGCV